MLLGDLIAISHRSRSISSNKIRVMNREKKTVIKCIIVSSMISIFTSVLGQSVGKPYEKKIHVTDVKNEPHWCLIFLSVMGPPKLDEYAPAPLDRNIRLFKKLLIPFIECVRLHPACTNSG